MYYLRENDAYNLVYMVVPFLYFFYYYFLKKFPFDRAESGFQQTEVGLKSSFNAVGLGRPFHSINLLRQWASS